MSTPHRKRMKVHLFCRQLWFQGTYMSEKQISKEFQPASSFS